MVANALAAVSSSSRFYARGAPCPACGGGADLPRHRGERCYGFDHSDPCWFTCTRLESPRQSAGGWSHRRLPGPCWCGGVHGDEPTPIGLRPAPTGAGVASSDEATLRLWSNAGHIAGTPAARYLHARGITVTPPDSLRHAVIQHSPTRTTHDALIAGVSDVDGRVVAVHRTYVAADGSRKAAVSPVRMMLGPTAGRSVHLGPAARRLAVTEGVETGLSVLLWRASTAAQSEASDGSRISNSRPITSTSSPASAMT